jgi:NADPH:quinone reductase-like Zn-dependent oxidoreductase
MKRRWKVLGGLGALLVAGVGVLAAVLSNTAACAPSPSAAVGPTMKAWVARCYGPPEVMAMEDAPVPALADDRVLVRVHAAGANPLDWHTLRGEPRIMRLSSGLGAPEDPRVGADFAGVVEQVGKDVTGFAAGERVFGVAAGAFAEFVVARPARLAKIPDSISYEQAAAVPIAAITALQSLRDKGRLQAGQKVLINGASGGVGTFAVQIAKILGAEVTGVCSTRNVEMVRGLGADHVIDYTQENFTVSGKRWDLIIDTVSNHGVFDLTGVLGDDGALVVVGSNDDEAFLGPVWRFLAATLADPFVAPRLEGILADTNAEDLTWLATQMAAGKLRSQIDRRFALADTDEAIRYLETGRARGKVVIAVP